MERPDWAPDDVDLERPSAARMYDYFLGGAHNFAADRMMADQAIQILPELPRIAQQNRAFLRRAVHYLVDQGITQFLDLGSGIPTAGNVHEIAKGLRDDARVVYVDIDPIAVTHAQMLLRDDPATVALRADLRQPEAVLDHPDVRGLLDFDRPIGLLMVAVLHFVPDSDRPADVLARYRAALAPGSHLVLSHGTQDGRPEQGARMTALYARTPTPLVSRSLHELTALLDGFELVEPGLVHVPLWRPDDPADVDDSPERYATYAGVARVVSSS